MNSKGGGEGIKYGCGPSIMVLVSVLYPCNEWPFCVPFTNVNTCCVMPGKKYVWKEKQATYSLTHARGLVEWHACKKLFQRQISGASNKIAWGHQLTDGVICKQLTFMASWLPSWMWSWSRSQLLLLEIFGGTWIYHIPFLHCHTPMNVKADNRILCMFHGLQ